MKRLIVTVVFVLCIVSYCTSTIIPSTGVRTVPEPSTIILVLLALLALFLIWGNL